MTDLPKMDTSVVPKSVKSTFGYASCNGTPDKPSQNKTGDTFVGQGIDSAEQSEEIDQEFQQMYGNLQRTLRGTK